MTDAVLLTCHGTVERVEDIPAFLANIRRGRPTPPEIVAEVKHRFELIGGSPLMRITAAQAEALSRRLDKPVYVAGRLWGPYPNEVLARAAADGVRSLLSLPLAPQSVDIYHASVREAAAAHPALTVRYAPSWGTEPLLVRAFVDAIDEALARFDATARGSATVVLTAHSLPIRVIRMGDPYEAQFRAMAGLVAEVLEARGQATRVAFQSQGMTGDEWLGPDLAATFTDLAARGSTSVVVAPIGFLADHVETLYDIDVEAQQIAKNAGISRLERMPAMNVRGAFIDALTKVASDALATP